MTRATDAADSLGLAYEITKHGRVNSLEEAAAARGIEPAKLIKTIVVRLSDGPDRERRRPGQGPRRHGRRRH